ncbi:uncharacterized protein LOC122258016 isoform X2 [Penaeus japonicus]|uniref:uncharacterized protein LOC122258016 isoform X2 n=1 Tax=Penaeus japonicus TaxID=27405 RepID=UPI001C716C59|nr:uncharacterized protein LOC122258016 isoform X2 [Penaeus japonicus]
MGFLRPCLIVAVLAAVSVAQLPFSVIPTISDELRAKALDTRATRFLRLWEYALKVDGQGPGPAIRVNFEAKTILAPGPLAYFNLIPQDASNPLYGKSKPLQALRRKFLLDHLVLDPIETTDPKLEEGDGVRALTFTGKDVYFKKDKQGKITVGGVDVQEVTSLKDGTQIYILEDLLFDNRANVQTAFNQRQAIAEELRKPLGPPLDIPEAPSSFPAILRSPAPPPPGLVGPPAIPTLSEDPLVRPPAPPPSFSAAGPPASPTLAVDPVVLPPASPPVGISGPPSPPPFRAQFSAPGAPPPLSPAAPPAAPPAAITKADDAIIFPSERRKRQLQLPSPEGEGDLDPAICCDPSDLAIPGGLSLVGGPEGVPPGDLYSTPGEGFPRGVSSATGDNRPLAAISAIEQFATLFELSGSSEDSVVGVLQREGLDTFLALLETSGILNTLVSGENGPFIVLAPSESAFSRLSRDDLRQLARGEDLSFHLVPLRGQSPPQVTDDAIFFTLDGSEVRFNVYDGATYVNGVAVRRKNIEFPQGVIYILESVLRPPLGDLQGVLVGSGTSVSRVNTLLTVTRLLDTGTYTLLAPPDSAITSKGYTWPRLLMDRAKGRDLMRRHTIPGALYTEGLLQRRTVRTLAGTSVTFRRDMDGTVSANGVPLLESNMTALNGVVHLSADVIPESDLGSDPTSLPHPLLSQTEASVFANFGIGDDLVPSIPAISGLYDLPDHDPFQDFVRKPETSTVAPLPESQRRPAITGGPLELFPTTNKIQAGTIPQWPLNKASSPALSSFLDMLDRTFDVNGGQTPAGVTISSTAGTTEAPGGSPDFLIIVDSTPSQEEALGTVSPASGVSSLIGFPGRAKESSRPGAGIVPVVPEGVAGCSPENAAAAADERSRLTVLTLLERLNLTRFLDLVRHAGLALTLSLEGPWTIFAPTNEAINAIPTEALQEMSDNPAFLRRLISYHLVPGRFTSSASFSPGRQLPTLHAGYTLVLSYYTDGPVARWVAGGSVVTDLDETGSTGVVHVIDRVLYAPYGNVFTTSRLSPVLGIFTSLVADDEVLSLLFAESGPLTVFIPSDVALRNYTFPEDIQARRGWVLSHVVTGTWYTAGFSNTWPLVTVNNDTLETTTTSADRELITVNGVEIMYADITASNGVIHVIDSILFPPT